MSDAQLLVDSVVIPESQWVRSEFVSIWNGPDLELIVVQNARSSDGWRWTCRGWREPDDDWAADRRGWVEAASREIAEKYAMRFYLQKDE